MESCKGLQLLCGMPKGEDEGQMVEVFAYNKDQDSCQIDKMPDYQNDIVDPKYGFVATIDLELSDDIDTLIK